MKGYEVIQEHIALKPYLRFIDKCSLKMYHKTMHRHHIVPKAMDGGDELDNLVSLSVKDHTEAHKLLTECLECTPFTGYYSKMKYASDLMIKRMSNQDKPKHKKSSTFKTLKDENKSLRKKLRYKDKLIKELRKELIGGITPREADQREASVTT